MQGPYSQGTYTGLPAPSVGAWEQYRLVRGNAYRVIKTFNDADNHNHPVGETWIFLGAMFNKFDNELVLCVRLAESAEWKIPLIWQTDKQQDVIESWKAYLAQA
jgi:hypothetical protein